MFKTVFIFLFGLMIFQTALAQKPDSVLYYMKNNGKYVANKDSADYYSVIMPKDTVTKLFPLKEYYINGKIKLTGATSTRADSITFEGECVSYFENGHKKGTYNYNKGNLIGNILLYYPNGNLYAIEQIDENGRRILIQCRDSTGNITADNGRGKWLKFDNDVRNIEEEGNVNKGLEEDEWYYRAKNDTTKYAIFYIRGKRVSPVGDNTELVYAEAQTPPIFLNGKQGAFNKYLKDNIIFPTYDREHNVQGRVIVTFIVEKDGSLSNVIALREPDMYIANEAVRVISLSPLWSPGLQNGKPVRTQFTISFAFSLAGNN